MNVFYHDYPKQPVIASLLALGSPLLAFAATCYEPYTETGCGTGPYSGSVDYTVCPNGTISWQSDTGRFNTARATSVNGYAEMVGSQSSCEVVRTYLSPCTTTPESPPPSPRSIFTTVTSNAVQGGNCYNPI